jgi:DNA-directed RNA polymerase specialized sigma24 family protein
VQDDGAEQSKASLSQPRGTTSAEQMVRDIEEYDTREVAALLGISESNVKVRLHRARSALKKRLEPILRGEIS